VTNSTEVGGYHHSGRHETPVLRSCSRGFRHVDYRENSLESPHRYPGIRLGSDGE
jgi:hypothetical protein